MATIHRGNAAVGAAFPAILTPVIEKTVTQVMQRMVAPLAETCHPYSHNEPIGNKVRLLTACCRD